MPARVEFRADGIVYIVALGEQTEKDVISSTAAVDRYIKDNGIKDVRYLVDVTHIGQVSPGARKALKSRLKTIEHHGRVRYALLGVSPTFTPLIQLFVKAVRTRSEFRFFKEEREALAWLGE